jgi:cytochrome c oxidase cbb3-type subunit 3
LPVAGRIEVGMKLVFALFVFLSLASYLTAQPGEVPPHTPSPDDVKFGANIFHSHCAECHGLSGEGGRGPDLTRGSFRHGATDEALFRTITYGITGTQMPGSYFPAHQIWQVVAFVKSLSHPNSADSILGSASSGATLFRRNGCSKCHLIGGEGGRLGPDLTDIGSIRSAAYLRTAIADPNAKSIAGYRAVRIVDNSGKQISGVRLNEDTYSIQIMDYQENLRSLLRRDLREVQVSKDSAMPAFSKLPATDLDDLTAYLCSLKKKAGK